MLSWRSSRIQGQSIVHMDKITGVRGPYDGDWVFHSPQGHENFNENYLQGINKLFKDTGQQEMVQAAEPADSPIETIQPVNTGRAANGQVYQGCINRSRVQGAWLPTIAE